MKINGINGNSNVYGLYNSMLQGNMSLYNNKLSKSFLPSNNTQQKETLGSGAIGYVTNLKSASKNLSSTIKELSTTAFSSRTIASSDNDKMTVKYSGQNTAGFSPISVNIKQTAAAQQNTGAGMEAASYKGNVGANQFTIEKGGKTTQFDVKVEAGDSNKDVQQKMADAINKSGIGVKATVETDEKTKTSVLKLESDASGSDAKNGFTIKDKTGDLVARTKAGDVTQKGRDAIYSVNGGADRKSATNNVSLGNGVTAELKKATDGGEVTVSRGKNNDYAMSAVESLVKNYNELYSASAQNTDDLKAQKLATKMVNTSKAYIGTLSNVGIGFDKDGKMTLDKAQLSKASESGKLEQFFTENSGKNYGFTNQLSKLADNVTRNTSSYVSSSQFGSALSQDFSYSSFGDLIQYNFLSAGSIFDYSF